jgi:hypothetical protein
MVTGCWEAAGLEQVQGTQQTLLLKVAIGSTENLAFPQAPPIAGRGRTIQRWALAEREPATDRHLEACGALPGAPRLT